MTDAVTVSRYSITWHVARDKLARYLPVIWPMFVSVRHLPRRRVSRYRLVLFHDDRNDLNDVQEHPPFS